MLTCGEALKSYSVVEERSVEVRRKRVAQLVDRTELGTQEPTP